MAKQHAYILCTLFSAFNGVGRSHLNCSLRALLVELHGGNLQFFPMPGLDKINLKANRVYMLPKMNPMGVVLGVGVPVKLAKNNFN